MLRNDHSSGQIRTASRLRALRGLLGGSLLRGGILAGILLGAGIGAAAAPTVEKALIVAPSLTEGQVRHLVEQAKGRMVAFVPELSVALVRLSPDRGSAMLRVPHLEIYRPESVAQIEDLTLSPGARVAALVERLLGSPPADSGPRHPLPEDDALLAPPWWELEVPALVEELAPGGRRPFGAEWMNTSEYLAGKVSVNLLLPESNGAIDPDREEWTEALETQVLAETLLAVDELATLYPQARLSFTVHLLSGRADGRLETGYEPIARPADPSGPSGEKLWTSEVLEHLGYGEGSPLARSRLLADQTRIADRSDWAVNLFVVNATRDGDGRFEDGRLAYAWLGGPHAVLTAKAGDRGSGRWDGLLLHELHHLFYALDQKSPSACAEESPTGYLGLSGNLCGSEGTNPQADVMLDGSVAAGALTRAQVGTLDADRDGLPDILGLAPEVSLELTSPDPACDGLVLLEGRAEAGSYPNSNPLTLTPRRDIVLSHIVRIEIRVDNGSWQRGLVYPEDGRFDSAVEEFDAGLTLPDGRHHIEVRAIDNLGLASTAATRAVDVAAASHALGATLRIASTPGGPTITWKPAPGAASYRIRRASQPGAVKFQDTLLETAASSWSDVSPGTAFYEVVAVDGCGREIP